MDIDLTGSKKEITDLIDLVKGCPAYTNIRVSSFDRLNKETYSCRIEYTFDPNVPSGKDSPNVFAKYQRALSHQGGYAGGRSPYGYHAEKGTYVIDEKEAPVVREIFALRKEGASLNGIAKHLNEQNIPSRTGGKWRYTAIQSILSNRNTYLGYYHYGNGTPWVPGTHRPILNPSLYVPDFTKEGFKEEDDSSSISPLTE